MITNKISLREGLEGTVKFLSMKAGRTLFSLNLEVTRRCNLRCRFCDYWKTQGPEQHLSDYSDIVHHLAPLHLTITGGEPLLRHDLEAVIQAIRNRCAFTYMNVITNGRTLTVERGLSLWRAGLSQLSVSLDFPDERHERHRGRAGLWDHLVTVLPGLRETEIDNLCLNTVIMNDNLDDLLEIARLALQWGWKVSYSTYNPYKSDNSSHTIPHDRLNRLETVIQKLLAWKRRHGNITNSDFYLENIVRYFRDGGISGCLAGRKWVQVGPDGELRRCADKEALPHWKVFRPNTLPRTSCRECWYACRGESEAPLGIRRILELNR